jgi:hypothetical protein
MSWVVALAFGLIVYGVALTAAITSGAWFGRDSALEASPALRMRRKDAHVEIDLMWNLNCFKS